MFSYNRAGTYILLGSGAGGFITAGVSDGTNTLTATTSGHLNALPHISILKKSNKTINLEYYDFENSKTATDNDSSFDNTFAFNTAPFNVGSYAGGKYLDGQLNELIIFNRALSDAEIAEVRGYLNLKYKIY